MRIFSWIFINQNFEGIFFQLCRSKNITRVVRFLKKLTFIFDKNKQRNRQAKHIEGATAESVIYFTRNVKRIKIKFFS